jgi:hypothetical protein
LAALLIPAAKGQGGAPIRANIRGGSGDGKGLFVQRNGPRMRVWDVIVNLARNGAINLAFQAQGVRGGPLTFARRAM